jgi:hypothetical protein
LELRKQKKGKWGPLKERGKKQGESNKRGNATKSTRTLGKESKKPKKAKSERNKKT